MTCRRIAVLVFLLYPTILPAAEPIRLANTPALSPDGSTLAFSWAGDIWTVPGDGGMARPITRHPSRDLQPRFSRDGKEIAFVSDREGSMQVFVMPVDGSDSPRQITFHSQGSMLEGYFPDGQALLVSGSRDHYWHSPIRFFKVARDQRAAEALIFDDYGHDGALSPDGKQLLFAREGTQWWRKGYRGSQQSQVWLYDLAAKTFAKLLEPEGGALFPLWKPDGKGFYYIAVNDGAFNLWDYQFDGKKSRPLTSLKDDSVVYPCISKDGSTIVFRHLFDLYRFRPGKDDVPRKLAITRGGDGAPEKIERRTLTTAEQVAFSKDGLEIAFIAGGDLWVMDTELLEPKQVTNTPEEERNPIFSPDGDALLVVSDQDGQSDIYRVEKAEPAAFWWQNSTFKKERLTNNVEVESRLKWSPDGTKVGFIKGRGDLWVMDPKGKDARAVVASWDAPEFDWSADGKWLVYAQFDNDFNRDIYIVPVDGSKPPFNVSRHPDVDSDPVWSPDGKTIAFTGRRGDNEVDIYYVFVAKDEDEKESRDRRMEKAVEKITKTRKKASTRKAGEAKKDDEAGKSDKKPVKIAIDFDGIHERIRHVLLPGVSEANLFWSPDSKKLAFSARIDGRTGLFTIEIPDNLGPRPLSTAPITQARWLEQGNLIVGLSGGSPASFPAGGGGGSPSPAAASSARSMSAPRGGESDGGGGSGIYRFRARQEVDLPRKYRAAFDLAWRQMRDHFYDERLGNRNWDAIRRKYADAAAEAPDPEGLATVINLMLGELNGSHLGFSAFSSRLAAAFAPGETPSSRWNLVTAHLGLRFVTDYRGPGLKVKDVIGNSPADHKKSKVEPGEIIVSIDGVNVDPSMDLTRVLNGPIDRDIHLVVRDRAGKERTISLRPIPFGATSRLLYEQFIKDCRKTVDRASKGRLGYLHIQGMSFPSFHRFEQELYAVGSGKDGLIIDVRNNGGGSTTDHLLTALTQPIHAITVPRGGGQGYPQDRKIYATWNKPIVVLCNQNSFSNAEIFSHAIKTLKRGPLVGVPTAGGVLSTGGARIMDLGVLRMPTRGWYTINDGEDMELHGAVPDQVIWPQPGELPAGKDVQLNKAVEVLLKEVDEFNAKPRPKLKKSSER